MATARFRPVILRARGEPGSALVYVLLEAPDGLAVLREFDWPVPLTVPLDRVTVADLPVEYQQPDLEVVIGPIERTVAAEDELIDRISDRLDELEAQAARDGGVSTRRDDLHSRRESTASSPSGSSAEQR